MNWSYLFKHWFGTLLIGPIVSDIIAYLIIDNSDKIGGLTGVYPIALLFGLIFSTPTYILYGIIYYFLAQKEIATKYSKIILILFTSLCIFSTFTIVFNAREFNICVAYAITSILLGFIFKLNFK